MSACGTCGAATADDRDFCGSCGAYLRWDDPETDEAPTAILAPAPDDPPTTVLEVEPPRTVEATEAVRITLADPADPGAELGAPRIRVAPGGRALLTGVVFNQSGIVDSFSLRITGLDPAWWTIAPATVNLVPFGSPEGEPEQRVEVHLHPPRAPEAEARDWEIALVAQSRSQGSDAAKAGGTVTIEPYEQLDCRVRPQVVRDRRSGRLAVPVRNLGNAPAWVHFEGEDDEGVLRMEFSPPSLTLGPGLEAQSALTVTASKPVRGSPVHRQLTIAAAGEHERAERQATFIQEPAPVRSYRVPWRIGLTLLGALLLFVGALLSWDDAGDAGLCANGYGACLSFDEYLKQAGIASPAQLHPETARRLVAAVTSLGLVPVVLAVLTLVGARRGGLTWIAGCVAILFAIAMIATLHGAAIGVWVVLLGGVAAVAAGALARG
jgi:hypothetical protein